MASGSAGDAETPRCLACGASDLRPFLGPLRVPVHCNVLWPTREEALAAPEGSLRLAVCGRCAMIVNLDFDERLTRYAPDYENALHFSPTFRAFAEALAAGLVERHGLRGRRIVEIGCGDGHFLDLLCRAGGNQGLGLDPSQPHVGPVAAGEGSLEILPEVWAPGRVEGADAVCARHVVEHIAAPRPLLEDIRTALGGRPGALLYVEVPDAEHMLVAGAIWDAIYEHVGYYSRPPLERLLGATGFRLARGETGFGGQFLCAEATPAQPGAAAVPDAREEVDRLIALAAQFAATREREVSRWERSLREWHAAGRRIAVWGAGSKGVTFLNTVPGADGVAEVVDVNARKHARHVPGTGQAVAGPEAVGEREVDVVLLMNGNYEREVATVLADSGRPVELVVV